MTPHLNELGCSQQALNEAADPFLLLTLKMKELTATKLVPGNNPVIPPTNPPVPPSTLTPAQIFLGSSNLQITANHLRLIFFKEKFPLYKSGEIAEEAFFLAYQMLRDQYPNDEDSVFKSNAAVIFSLDRERLVNFVKKFFSNDRYYHVFLIVYLNQNLLMEKLPIILEAINSQLTKKNQISPESMINDLLQGDLLSGLNYKNVLNKLRLYQDIMQLKRNDFSELEKKMVILRRVDNDFKTRDGSKNIYFENLGRICPIEVIQDILNACIDLPIDNKPCLRNFLQGIFFSTTDLTKIKVAMSHLWFLFITISQQDYDKCYQLHFDRLSFEIMGAILSTFPSNGKKEWLVELLVNVHGLSLIREGEQVLPSYFKANPHFYSHLDDEVLEKILSHSSLREAVKLDRKEYADQVSTQVMNGSLIPWAVSDFITSYLIPQRTVQPVATKEEE